MVLKWWLITLFIVIVLICIAVIINVTGKRYDVDYLKEEKQVEQKIFKNRLNIMIMLILIIALFIGLYYHYWHLSRSFFWTSPVVVISFIWMTFLIFSACTNPIYLKNEEKLKTVIVIPVYNEDPNMLRKVLASISKQTKKADVVCVIEDGSKLENKCEEVFCEWRKTADCQTFYQYIENSGKREAQAIAFKTFMHYADIFITIDSDTLLDSKAIEEGLKPFSDPTIVSVAGLLVDYNRTNLLTKIVGLGFVSSFTNGRAAWSKWKSVSVSCGGLAFYRSKVIKEFLYEYLNQQLFKQKANFGDDRMMTQYASLLGKTVFQETALGYTLLPEKLSHLTRQRIRWWRSFWWGGVWILRHQSMKKGIWWLTLTQYISFSLYSVVFPFIMIIYPIMNHRFPLDIFIYMMILSYIRTARTLTIKREDISFSRQFVEYLIVSPVSTLFNLYLCTVLQYVALFTVWKCGNWGTREGIEVYLDGDNSTENIENSAG